MKKKLFLKVCIQQYCEEWTGRDMEPVNLELDNMEW